MQYYTRQQLQGSGRYMPKVLIGNWNEDRCVQETVLKDFLAKSDAKSLKIDHFQASMSQALAPVELTVVRNDGFVHFGDMLQLVHAGPTCAALSGDINDIDRRTGERACAATAALEITKPCARNTFILAKYTAPRLDASTTHYEDDVLRYGQKIRVIANPAISGERGDAGGGGAPRCLFSKPVSTTHHAKYSHGQVVGLTTRSADYSTVFQVVTPDPAHRIASDGVEVLPDVPVCLQHCATNALLHLEAAVYPNEFGAEREVSCKTAHGHGKKMMLIHEQNGALASTLASKQPEGNQFRFVVGSTVAALAEPEAAAAPADSVLRAAHAALLRSTRGLSGLREKLLRMDVSGSGSVHVDEVILAFSFVGLRLARADADLLLKQFGTPQAGMMDVRALLEELDTLGGVPE